MPEACAPQPLIPEVPDIPLEASDDLTTLPEYQPEYYDSDDYQEVHTDEDEEDGEEEEE
ncbi:hypothetical protein CPB97_005674, partial [Podila verticillata]